MRVFILRGVEKLTDSYHSSGGLVVIAKDEADARDVVRAYGEARGPIWRDDLPRPIVTDAEWASALMYELAGFASPQVIVFADAGCC